MTKKEIDGWKCASPQAIEDFIKNCQQGVPYLENGCVYNYSSDLLRCELTGALPFADADNYGCTSMKDFKRIIGRCK